MNEFNPKRQSTSNNHDVIAGTLPFRRITEIFAIPNSTLAVFLKYLIINELYSCDPKQKMGNQKFLCNGYI